MKKMPLLLIVVALSAAAAVAQPAPTPKATPSDSPKTNGAPAKPAIVLPAEKSQPIRLPKFDKPPLIDGKLDDEVWKHAVVLKDFYQVQPGDNIAPSKPTEVLLGYDSKFLYVAFHCYDEPDKVRATIPKRDNVWNDDYVGILFDTFNDSRKAYEFDFSPLGVQADGIWTDGQDEDFNPDFVFESKGIVTNDGWTVEIAIPFKSLRYVAGKDKLWGAHFWRRIKRFNNELDMWMPLNRDISSWLAQEGHLAGLEGISTERTLELIPSLTLSETGKRKATLTPDQVNAGMKDPGRFVNEPVKFDPGLTGKFSITPNVTLDFAINPDFAQVESDQLVVTANQRFPIFFSEKRPFFLEGIDIFNTQIAAVHTRTIIDPDYAVKLTGKVDRKENGFIYATDLNMSGRHLGYDYSTVGRTRYYRADVGFNRRTNTNNHNLFVQYRSEPKPKARLVSWRVYNAAGTNFDWQGRSQVFNNESQIQFNFQRQTSIGIGYDQGYERVFEEEFGAKRQPGSNCALLNTCTFCANDNERSESNGGLYVFAISTWNEKSTSNVFADDAY